MKHNEGTRCVFASASACCDSASAPGPTLCNASVYPAQLSARSLRGTRSSVEWQLGNGVNGDQSMGRAGKGPNACWEVALWAGVGWGVERHCIMRICALKSWDNTARDRCHLENSCTMVLLDTHSMVRSGFLLQKHLTAHKAKQLKEP